MCLINRVYKTKFKIKKSVGFNAVCSGINLLIFFKIYPLQFQSRRRNVDAAVFSEILVNLCKSKIHDKEKTLTAFRTSDRLCNSTYLRIILTNFRPQTLTSNVLTLLCVLTEFYFLLVLSHQMRG